MLLAVPATGTLVDALRLLSANTRQELLPLLGGVAAYFAIPYLKREPLLQDGFWNTHHHEHTHLLFASLTMHDIERLEVGRSDGQFAHWGNGNWLITIAPYFFPTLALLVGCVTLVLAEPFRPWGVGAIGFALASFAVGLRLGLRADQRDLGEVGVPFAVAFCPGAIAIWVGFVLALAAREGGAAWFFSRLAWRALALFV